MGLHGIILILSIGFFFDSAQNLENDHLGLNATGIAISIAQTLASLIAVLALYRHVSWAITYGCIIGGLVTGVYLTGVIAFFF